MAKSKKKYYVVWQGVNPGIYNSWAECQLQIKGFPAAKYKSYPSLAEAKAAYGESYSQHIGGNAKKNTISKIDLEGILEKNSIAVDAACSGNPGLVEYQGVNTFTKDRIFYGGPFKQGTNNLGEFLALTHALAYAKKTGQDDLVIYSDSRTAMSWVRNKKIKTLLKKTPENEPIFSMVNRALIWLHNNTFENKIIKWETKSWGEIPADFGRK